MSKWKVDDDFLKGWKQMEIGPIWESYQNGYAGRLEFFDCKVGLLEHGI